MKRKTVMSQMISRIGIVLFLVGSLTIALIYYFISTQIGELQKQDVHTAAKIVTNAMQSTQTSTGTIENLINQKLLTASKGIAKELQGKTIEQIHVEDLVRLKEEWGLYDISLFVRKGDDIVVAQSSQPKEIGLSSKGWGYWYDAFDQLLSNKKVTVAEGYTADHFWAGPISLSEWDDKYLLYGYYHDENTPFLINPYILDKDIYNLTFQSGTNQMIEKLNNEMKSVEEVAIINVPAWMKGKENKIFSPDTDKPLLYGTHSYSLPEDNEVMKTVMNNKGEQAVQFKSGSEHYTKFYVSLPQNRVMTMVLNSHFYESMQQKLMLFLVMAFLILFIAIFVLVRIIAKRQLSPLKQLANHLQHMSEGDMTRKLNIKEDNEWGWLANQINDMTDKISLLISGFKDQVRSLTLLSFSLAERVHVSLDTMNQTSTSMTDQARMLFTELSYQVETLMQDFNKVIDHISNMNLDEQVKTQLQDSFDKISEQLSSMEHFMKSDAHNMTEISMMFNDTLKELTGAINLLNNSSLDLQTKIEVFRINEE